MRISDWSSDVCSSDLLAQGAEGLAQARLALALAAVGPDPLDDRVTGRALVAGQGQHRQHQRGLAGRKGDRRARRGRDGEAARSEEHTSELQSLMRNTYAVLCLKKKTDIKRTNTK